MRDRPAELIRELGFLPLNSREEFNAWKKFFEREEFNDQSVRQELEALDELWGEQAAELQALYLHSVQDDPLRKAAMYFKLIRYSYASAGRSFGCQPFSISSVFPLIQDVAKRLEHVVIENQDFEVLIRHYDRPDAFFYCDPPYFDSEYVYDAPFSWEDHQRLNRVLRQAQGKWLLSYNDCEEIRELYRGYALFDFQRVHTMVQRFDAGREFHELLIGNYDLYEREKDKPAQLSMQELLGGTHEPIDVQRILKERILPCKHKK